MILFDLQERLARWPYYDTILRLDLSFKFIILCISMLFTCLTPTDLAFLTITFYFTSNRCVFLEERKSLHVNQSNLKRYICKTAFIAYSTLIKHSKNTVKKKRKREKKSYLI